MRMRLMKRQDYLMETAELKPPIEITTMHPITQLFLAKKSTQHRPEAGLNPLVDAAAYLFSLMGKLRKFKNCPNLNELHEELAQAIDYFQETMQLTHYRDEHLDEYLPISCYALCVTFDDIISSMPWGDQGKWDAYSLVPSFNAETLSPESFLIILERLVRDPIVYIDVIEFLYICFSLGFRHHAKEFSVEQFEQIINSLYERIRAHRGHSSRILSPSAITRSNITIKPHHTSRVSIGLTSLNTFLQGLGYFIKKKLIMPATLNNVGFNLERLERKFFSAIKFFKRERIHVQDTVVKLNELPWYFVMGTSGSGKTTLLANANAKYFNDQKLINGNAAPLSHSEFPNWWLLRRAVMVDIPGDYLIPQKTTFTDPFWNQCLTLTKMLRRMPALSGCIVTLSLEEVIDKDSHHELLDNLVARLNELRQEFNSSLPFHFAITKCDLLPGFLEFFQDYCSEELSQAWGVVFPPPKKTLSLVEHFTCRFNILIKRLNKQLITRLHQERNIHVKSAIKDFPLHVEQLKEALISLLNKLVRKTQHLYLKGIYLTSATQSLIESKTPKLITSECSLGATVIESSALIQQTYFVKQFILQVTNSN